MSVCDKEHAPIAAMLDLYTISLILNGDPNLSVSFEPILK